MTTNSPPRQRNNSTSYMNDPPTPKQAPKFVQTCGLTFLRYIRKLHESVSQKMANCHVRVLHAPVMLRIDSDDMARDFRQLPALPADQRHGLQLMLIRPFKRLHEIRRISADTHRQHDVTLAPKIRELLRKNLIVSVIIPQRRHPGRVVIDRHAPKSRGGGENREVAGGAGEALGI